MWLEVGHKWDCTKSFKASMAFGEYWSSSTLIFLHRSVP